MGSCKEMFKEGLYTPHPASPNLISCITVVQYQYQETNIGIIHRGGSDLIIDYSYLFKK